MEPFIGEIRMFGGNFAPLGWMFCEGQLISISEYDVLFQLIGTTYGGDGQTTFALPDLRGRLPIHQGNGHVMGEQGGTEDVTLIVNQIPAHTHPLICNDFVGNSFGETGVHAVAAGTTSRIYTSQIENNAPLNSDAVRSKGGSQSHSNRMPFLCVSFIISLFGIFPSHT